MGVPVAASEVLASAEARAAVLAGKRGTLIRLARQAMGLRQADLGRLLGYSQSTISRIESGRQHANDMSVLSAAAELLGIPPTMLGLAALPGCSSPAFSSPMAGTVRRDDVNRLEFLGVLAGTAASSVLGMDGERRQFGARDARVLRGDLRKLYELDDHHGGGDVYALAARTVGMVRRAVENGTYREQTGRVLWSMIGELTEHVGWLAYDAERHEESRRWWLEALHLSRLIDDEQVETVVMASMSLQASRRGSGRESVDLARAAQKASRNRSTPRLRSLLLAREALGHARSRDTTTTLRALRRARLELGRTRSVDDDPLWLGFYDEADLAWHHMLAAMDLGDLPAAEAAIREALTAVGPQYPRNHALYLVQLADVLIAQGRIDEGLVIASRAVSRASDLGSRRVDLQVDAVRRRLAPFWRMPEVRGFLEWSSQLLAGRVAPVPAPGRDPGPARTRALA